MTVEEFKEAWFKGIKDCPYQIIDSKKENMKLTRIASEEAQVGDYVGEIPVYEVVMNDLTKIEEITHDVGYKDGYCRINNDYLWTYDNMVVIRIRS